MKNAESRAIAITVVLSVIAMVVGYFTSVIVLVIGIVLMVVTGAIFVRVAARKSRKPPKTPQGFTKSPNFFAGLACRDDEVYTEEVTAAYGEKVKGSSLFKT